MRSWSSLILLSAALAAQAAPPQRVEVVYELRREGKVIAEVTDRLEHDGRSYRLSETWKGRGAYALRGEAKRSSRGAIVSGGLQPEAFEDERPGRETARVTPAAGQQDRLSVLWHLAFAPPASAVTLQVADRRGVSAHTYAPAGRESLKTPAGEFGTLKLARKDGRSQVWLATDRGHIPIRILVTDKDSPPTELVAVRVAP